MMTRGAADPWRASVAVAQIPTSGLRCDLEADPATRRTLAEVAGLRDLVSAHAEFDLLPESGGKVHVTGRLRARIGQSCVVTLDPIENEIDEPIDLTFAPVDQLEHLDDQSADDDDGESNVSDKPEPIEDGMIDLGRLATDVLFLAINPYPRKPGVAFEPQIAAADPEDHPFAALKVLKPDAALPSKPKRKGK